MGKSAPLSKVTGLTHLTFTDANWNTPQIVLVNAVDDGALEGTELSTITHQIISTGGKYFALPERRLSETDRDGLRRRDAGPRRAGDRTARRSSSRTARATLTACG